jgi:hypothetical protein
MLNAKITTYADRSALVISRTLPLIIIKHLRFRDETLLLLCPIVPPAVEENISKNEKRMCGSQILSDIPPVSPLTSYK